MSSENVVPLAANPFYDRGEAYQRNCQRCVPTFELRSRGYSVIAKPLLENDDHLSYHPYDVWQHADIHHTSGSGLQDILRTMQGWEDGARAQIVLVWEYGGLGHTFVAEKSNGQVKFVDPQTGDEDVQWYFEEAKKGATTFARIDHLKPSQWIDWCCEEVDEN